MVHIAHCSTKHDSSATAKPQRCSTRSTELFTLSMDRTTWMKAVGKFISHVLWGGIVQEAFHHLKGWYRSVTYTQLRPCFQTMDWQTTECIDLHRGQDFHAPRSMLVRTYSTFRTKYLPTATFEKLIIYSDPDNI